VTEVLVMPEIAGNARLLVVRHDEVGLTEVAGVTPSRSTVSLP
jgi:hypothetical protein